jgi:hypothetical protein
LATSRAYNFLIQSIPYQPVTTLKRKSIMKRSQIAAGIAAALSLGVAAAAFTQPGPSRDSHESHGDNGRQHHNMGGMPHHGMGGMQHGAMGQRGAGMDAAHSLMTPEERTALRDKMHNATPEERQKLAQATRDQMQKRAKEKGIALPQHGQHGGPAHAH